MKEIEIELQNGNFEIEGSRNGIKLKAQIDVSDIINLFTVKEIEENIHEYEKLFILMKDYYRKVEERDDSFFH
jgi:hypothetical protein